MYLEYLTGSGGWEWAREENVIWRLHSQEQCPSCAADWPIKASCAAVGMRVPFIPLKAQTPASGATTKTAATTISVPLSHHSG